VNVSATIDQGEFADSIRRLRAVTGKEMDTLLRESARNFGIQAMRHTPPFGDAPGSESWQTQEKIGRQAVQRDVNRLFQSMDRNSRIRIFSGGGEFGKAILKLVREGDVNAAMELLRRAKIRPIDILPEPTRAHHNRWRDNRGRVRSERRFYLVDQFTKIIRFAGQRQEMVGNAKGGWVYALQQVARKLGVAARVPTWLKRQRSAQTGIYYEVGAGDRKQVTIGNRVPYMQRHLEHIEGRAWRSFRRRQDKDVRARERHIQRKLREARL